MANSSGVRSLTEIQIGKESVDGTSVAATRRIAATNVVFRRMETKKHFEDQMTGLLTGPAQAPVSTRNHAEIDVTWPLDFEQILWPLLSGMKGAVTPTQPGGAGPAELWTFTPGVAADPAPDPYTVEFVERSADDRAEMEFPFGLCSGWTITAGLEGTPEIVARFFGRKVVDSTFTSSIALPTITHASNARWGIFFDDTWANLGSTQVTGQILGFELTYSDAIRPAWYLDNRADLDFSKYEYGVRKMNLTMTVVHDPDSAKFIQTQEAIKSAGTQVTARIILTGAAFGAPDGSIFQSVGIDMAGYHADDSMQERGADQDGNIITTVHIESAYEAAQPQDIEVTVQNILTSFP